MTDVTRGINTIGNVADLPWGAIGCMLYALILFVFFVTFSMLFKPWASSTARFFLGFLITFATAGVFVLGKIGYTLDKTAFLFLFWLVPHFIVIFQYKNYVEKQTKDEKEHQERSKS